MMVTIHEQPYKHAFGSMPYLNDADFERILSELKSELPWNRVKKRFYDQHELSLNDIGADTLPWNNKAFHQAVRQMVECSLGVTLEPFFTATAHLLARGQYINPHTDAPGPGYESIRLGLVINDGDVGGGEIQILDGRNKVEKTISFDENNFFLLELSSQSWHAVRPIHRGTRYSVIFSFWEQTPEHYLNEKCVEDMLSRDLIALDDGFFLHSLHRLIEFKAHRVRHTGRNLLTHLVNTYRLLIALGAPNEVCRSGLWHSIYSQPLDVVPSRNEIAAIIGNQAEELTYSFSQGLWMDALECLDDAGRRNFLLLDYANFIDQLEFEEDVGYIARKMELYKKFHDILTPEMALSLKRIFGI
ncbi:DUF6817 domain-containing protein [Oligoflexus tunisiensis]|uniref:DUF6817 domain-containing protein n=1 Tax=Oligoflexus tunisiensis TaxID=708132 RepID=UPI00114D242F|nr:2OG-Fe(II) oxygenase [Oligoflexus tunisiensis]